MYTVKFTPYRAAFGAIAARQTPGGSMMSADGRYRFVIDPELREADFWVVQGKGVRAPERCRVAPENTIMLTTEPRSVLSYPRSFLKQFGVVASCQEGTNHPGLRLMPPVLPWFVGFKHGSDGAFHPTLTLDDLRESAAPRKTKLLSVITSNKAFTRGHIRRIRFVEKLKEAYGDLIDIYGHGFNTFDDKWEVLAPYKYHIVIENSGDPYYWTEKLGDCYLAETFPLYYGCTNLTDYFPPEAFREIDIDGPFEQARAIIDEAIAGGLYEQSAPALRECRDLMLGRYNMFEVMARICDTLNPAAKRRDVVIKPCRSMMHWRNALNYIFTRNFYKLKLKIEGTRL